MAMDYAELVKKINSVIENVDIINKKLKEKLSNYSNIIVPETNNQLKYQYEVSKKAYQMYKTQNKIEKNNYFKNRCKTYINYLTSCEEKDLIKIKKNEYEYLRAIQNESIQYYETKYKELKMREKIEKLVGEEEPKSKNEMENIIKQKNKAYRCFMKCNFAFNDEKIYSLDYLNYDINETIDLVYSEPQKKKAS